MTGSLWGVAAVLIALGMTITGVAWENSSDVGYDTAKEAGKAFVGGFGMIALGVLIGILAALS